MIQVASANLRAVTQFRSHSLRILFNSLIFILFFAVVLALNYSPLPWRTEKANRLLLLFY